MRAATGNDSLDLAEDLQRLTGGFDTEVFAVRLVKAPPGLSGPLVLRLHRSPRDSGKARIETAIHAFASERGHPVPAVPIDATGHSILGRPFLLMERAPGVPLMAAMSDPAILRSVPRLLARVQSRMHSLPAAGLVDRLNELGVDPAGLTPFRLLDDIHRLVDEAGLSSLSPLAGWLDDRRPQQPPEPSICHGDFHPGNIIVEDGRVTGVIDWPNLALGHAEYDVAITRLIISIGPIDGLDAPSAAREEGTALATAEYLATYREVGALDGELLDYYTTLRAAHAFVKVAAASVAPDVRGVAHEQYAWRHPVILGVITRTIERITGFAHRRLRSVRLPPAFQGGRLVVQETEQDVRIPHDQLLQLVTGMFRRCGMRGNDARLLSDTLVVADLEGVHSHGVLRVPEYVKKLTVDGVDPRGSPRVERDEGACLVVDGGNSMGQIGATFAMREVIERARRSGIAAAAVRGSNHCGAMSYYVRMAVDEGMIGIATTNALPTMAPIGGTERVLGINPIGFGIPAGQEPPIIYDASFGGSAHGKIRVYAQKGLPIPDDWALDADGRPTTDPVKAMAGLIRPIGGHKGAGLAMVMGILSSILSGAAYGTELGDMEHGPKPGRDGHFVAAIRIGAFEDEEKFRERIARAIREIRGVRKAPGVPRVYVPGEVEAVKRARYEREGIPLNPSTLADIRQAAANLEVDVMPFSWLRE